MAALTRPIQLLTSIVLVLALQQCSECKNDINYKDQPVFLVKHTRTSFKSKSEDLNSIPVIVWHGMRDTAGNQKFVSKLIEDIYPGTPVYAVKVGDTEQLDSDASVWGDPNSQIDRACKAIIENDKIKKMKKVNFVGFSQGALLSRGLIERCPFEKHSIQVNNFISIGGPQQGVYGLPEGSGSGKVSSYLLNKGASMLAYMKYFQNNWLPANYWHDPKKEASYRMTFLADINNEGPEYHSEYKKRLQSINMLVLVSFTQDSTIRPNDSSFFGFYRKESGSQIESMTETPLYQNDLIGLKSLNDNNRIHFIQLNTAHLDFSDSWFRNEIVQVYLMPSNDLS